ncbi:MAG: flavodoxin domain-containing protein [Candidatus Bathyarchaeota archaeon]|nr:flavodoxin domain-containing protein [Candidatus Bathyarchaeota archaeon]MDW8040748.1 flavodoxin domain-containing protein [Nitrososphaerota archaeon]
MPKILVLYYSKTGNTEKMANAVVEGAKTVQGVEVELAYYATAEQLKEFDAIIVGTPTYHHDTTIDIKKLFEDAATKNIDLKGKIGAAFGSYGWSGEAPRLVVEIMKNRFGMEVVEPPLLAKYTPDQGILEKCRELGRKIAERLIRK